MSKVAEQLAEIVKGLVDDPAAVEIDEEDHGDTVLLRVRVDEAELGRVIGRQGRTIKALRTLLEVRGADDDTFYELEIDED